MTKVVAFNSMKVRLPLHFDLQRWSVISLFRQIASLHAIGSAEQVNEELVIATDDCAIREAIIASGQLNAVTRGCAVLQEQSFDDEVFASDND